MGADRDFPISDLGYTTKEIADRLNCDDKTVYRMRKRGYGPPFKKLGRVYYYPIEEYAIWLQNQFGALKKSTYL